MSDTPEKKVEFSELSLPNMAFAKAQDGNGFYRVYKAPGDFVETEAKDANEAMEKSGVREPVKIEFITPTTQYILSGTDLVVKVSQKKPEENAASGEQAVSDAPKEDTKAEQSPSEDGSAEGAPPEEGAS